MDIRIPVIFEEDTSGLSKTTEALGNIKKAQDDFNKSRESTIRDLMNESLSETAVQIEAVAQAQATLNKVVKLEAQILTSKTGSYNQLTAQLELNRIRLNQLTLQERQTTKEGKLLEAQTRKITEELKKFTSQTGVMGKALGSTLGNLGEMRKELLALRNTSFAGKSVEQIDAINQRIGELTDGISDLKAVQTNFGTEFGSQLAGSLQVITAGVQGVVGALSILGVESETLNKLEKDIVNLIAVTQALGAIEDALAKGTIQATLARIASTAATVRDTIVKAVNTFQSNAQARAEIARGIATTGATIATRAAATATWLWNAALAANPVGIIVVAVLALTAGIVLLVRAMSESAAETKRLNSEVNKLAGSYDELLSFQRLQIGIADEIGKSDVEKTKLQQKLTEQRLVSLEAERQALLKLLEASGLSDEQSQRLNEISDQTLETLDEQTVLRLQLANAIKKEATDAKKAADEKAKIAREEAKRLRDAAAAREAERLKIEAANRQAFAELQKNLAKQITDEEQLTKTEQERLEFQRQNAIESLNLAEQELIARAKFLGQEEEILKIQTDFARLRALTNERYEKEITKVTVEEIKKRDDEFEKSLDENAALLKNKRDKRIEFLEKEREIDELRIDQIEKSGNDELTLEQFKEDAKLRLLKNFLEKRRQTLIDNPLGLGFDDLEIEKLGLEIEKVDSELKKLETLNVFDRIKEKFKALFHLNDEQLKEIGDQLSATVGNVFEGLQALNDAELTRQQQIVDARQEAVDKLQEQLDEELRLKEQGVANNSDLLKTQLETQTELLRKEEEKRLALEKKAAQLRLRQNALEIASNIALSVAKAIEANAKFGLVGVVTAAAQIASIFALIAKARAQAAQFEVPKLRKGARLQGATHEGGGIPVAINDGSGGRAMVEAEKDEWLIGTQPSKEHDGFLERLNGNEFAGRNLNRDVDFSRDFFADPQGMIQNLAPNFGMVAMPDVVAQMLPKIRETVKQGAIAKHEMEKALMVDAFEATFSKMGAGFAAIETAIKQQPIVISNADTPYAIKQTKGNVTTFSLHEPVKKKGKKA